MLPIHQRARADRHEPPTDETAHRDSLFRQLVRFVIKWIKVSWKDLIVMACLGAAALGIYEAPVAPTRNFPVTFEASGDIVYPQFAYPNRGWVISPALSGVISAVIPICVIILAQVRIRSFWDCNNALLGLLYSLILGALFQVILKVLIGGFRPYWLDVCRPDVSLAPSRNASGLNGVGFQQVMYTAEVCTNPDKGAIKTAMTSFPSGHATAAFAGYVFLFLWMNAKLKVWADFQTSFYWLALLLAPLLAAMLMACALTIDQAHNWYDIVGGAAIGTAVAFMSYRVCFAAVWDWRYNHIPLTRHQVFDYTVAAAAGPEYRERALWVRKLGWGRRRRAVYGRRQGGWGGFRTGAGKKKGRAGSDASSATYARGASTDIPPQAQVQAVRYPELVMRENGQSSQRAEGMV